MSYRIKLGNTTREIPFPLALASDHITPGTGLTVTVTLRKAGGSFAAPAGVVSEIANGWYKIAANATDANTLGPLILHATATGADPTDMLIEVCANDPDESLLDSSNGIEPSVTLRQALRVIFDAAGGGTTDGAGTATFHVKSRDGTKTRVTGTCDPAGNRTGIALGDLT